MVDLNKICSSTPQPVEPAKAETKKKQIHFVGVSDPIQTLDLEGHLIKEVGNSDQLKGMTPFTACNTEALDIAYSMLEKVLEEKGELQLQSLTTIEHVKSGVAVYAPMAKHIHQAVFDLNTYIKEVEESLNKKGSALSLACEGYQPQVKLMAYPLELNCNPRSLPNWLEI